MNSSIDIFRPYFVSRRKHLLCRKKRTFRQKLSSINSKKPKISVMNWPKCRKNPVRNRIQAVLIQFLRITDKRSVQNGAVEVKVEVEVEEDEATQLYVISLKPP